MQKLQYRRRRPADNKSGIYLDTAWPFSLYLRNEWGRSNIEWYVGSPTRRRMRTSTKMTITPAAASSILFWAQFSPDFQDRGCETLAVSDAIYKQPKPVELYYYGQLQIELLLCTLHESGGDRCGIVIITRVLQGYEEWSLYRLCNTGQWSVSSTAACYYRTQVSLGSDLWVQLSQTDWLQDLCAD